jgi:hypothetical protein
MKPKFTIVRKILTIISLGFLVIGGYFLYEYFHLENKFQNAVKAEPLSAQIDLSKPGKYLFPFKQTYSFAHAERLFLEFNWNLKTGKIPTNNILLNGLKGNYVIQDEIGMKILSDEIKPDYLPGLTPNSVQLARFYPFKEGQYTFTLNILEGPPKLVNIKQRLFARYELCGLERFPAVIAGGLSILAFLIGTVMGYFTLKPFFYKGEPQSQLPQKGQP